MIKNKGYWIFLCTTPLLSVLIVFLFSPAAIKQELSADISNTILHVISNVQENPNIGGGGSYPPIVTVPTVPPEQKITSPISEQPQQNNNIAENPVKPIETTENDNTNKIVSFLPAGLNLILENNQVFANIISNLGINNEASAENLKNYNIFLPTLEKIAGSSFSDLTYTQKEKIPVENMFVLLDNGKISSPMLLDFSDSKNVGQKINVFPDKKIRLIVKPKGPAESVTGYVYFIAPSKKVAFSGKYIPSFNLSLASLVGPNLSPNYEIQDSLTQNNTLLQPDSKFIISKFDYNDDDEDGIYIADIKTPSVDGQYEIITSINYDNKTENRKDINVTTLIDPEGYIYEKVGDKELRINNSVVSLHKLNDKNQYDLWSSVDYGQENPQTTDNTGKYSFLVPAGTYYLTVKTPGYYLYKSDSFTVMEGKEIHENIAVKKEFDLLSFFDLNKILIFILLCLVIYNFYMDVRRRKNR